MKGSRSIFLTVSVAILVCLWSLVAVATPGNPALYFTDNLTATSASTTVTNMEQALLDRLSAATTSIDAALYELDRVSIRDALIAAHNRGVLVRVVTDDDDGYIDNAIHFQALESAGITVVHDNRSSLMHNKFMVIDGQYVWTGSTNLTDNGLTLNHNNSLLFDAIN
ncbi:MAG: phospholipase D-like domain-containing protein, partial [Candidatus Promineifilaceae bacterium]